MRLIVDHLACARGGRIVLDGLSFRLEAGEALIVTGRNGAGKSTLLAALAGYVRPRAGSVRADELNAGALPENLHFVAHRDGLKAALSASENLAVAAALAGGGGVSPEAALDAVGLPGAAPFPVGALSAGQRRRVALARLLVAPRPLWLLDEPTTALDTAGAALATRLMSRHLAGGGLIVAATHAPLGLPGAQSLDLDGLRESAEAAP